MSEARCEGGSRVGVRHEGEAAVSEAAQVDAAAAYGAVSETQRRRGGRYQIPTYRWEVVKQALPKP
ncbi:MAG: hypothetical protein LBK25_09640 [Treponema sp.]|nr:hypothetical protein [Treponema sp.]